MNSNACLLNTLNVLPRNQCIYIYDHEEDICGVSLNNKQANTNSLCSSCLNASAVWAEIFCCDTFPLHGDNLIVIIINNMAWELLCARLLTLILLSEWIFRETL